MGLYSPGPASDEFKSKRGMYDPTDESLKGRCEGSGSKMKPYLDGAGFKAYGASYIAATAVAYHGGQAAAGRPERLFRDVSFFNNALQQRMKPETMSRAAMLRRNKIYRVDAAVIVRDYKQKHPNARKGANA